MSAVLCPEKFQNLINVYSLVVVVVVVVAVMWVNS
jgi:hypothetical protein